MTVRRPARWIVPVMMGLVSTLGAQAPPRVPRSFTLPQAIEYADQHYPSVRAALERIRAAQGQVDLARTNYLPGASLLWQSNRATANNIYGLLLPQGVIPPISGPVLPTTSGRSVWGSAGGVLFSWEPFDFGYRRAAVNVARSGERVARSEADLTRLDVEVVAAEACLALVASEQAARAAEANVSRWEVFDKSVHVLVDNELRPGADASRADAELAVARTRLIQAQTAEKAGHAALADILALAGTAVEVDSGQMLASSPPEDIPAIPVAAHPAAATERARVEEFKAEKEALERSYVPRFFTQAAVSGRGSGANPNGTDASGLNGLGLERANYAAGITINFPVFDYFSNRAEKKIVDANERAEAARYDQTLQDLSDEVEQVRAALDGARQVAANTPVELAAARASETQARARYQAGLTTVVEVAESEGLLVQAEIDDSVARLNVWRGLANVAAAQGNLQPFVELLGKTTP